MSLRYTNPAQMPDVNATEASQAMRNVMPAADFDDVAMESSVAEPELRRAASDTDSKRLWSDICCATSDLSAALCEQLRIMLQPQIAASLGGAFRTGSYFLFFPIFLSIRFFYFFIFFRFFIDIVFFHFPFPIFIDIVSSFFILFRFFINFVCSFLKKLG
jgi:hypothetical protein